MLERVMIISGESSGELYGALLARTLRILHPDIKIIGVGGTKMEDSGVELISTISGAFGISELFREYKKVKETFNKVLITLQRFNPQVLILIDFPDFNIRIAKKAKSLGIKILYYVSPQIWAWRSSRIKTLGKLVDKMAVILPFEEDIYKKAGIPCEFVGHPALDEIRDFINKSGLQLNKIGSVQLKQMVRLKLGLETDKTLIALMPGSRPHEIRNLLPILIDVINELKKDAREYKFIIPIAPNLDYKHLFLFNSIKKDFEGFLFINKDPIGSLIASDIAIIASGTATLQAALLEVPLVVVYKLSPITYFLGRLLVKIKHFSLVNILLDKSVTGNTSLRIKEFLQRDVNKNNIIDEILRILYDDNYRKDIQIALQQIKELFINKNASLRVAELTKSLLI